MKQTYKPAGIQSSLLDGCIGFNWYYAIGMYNYTHDTWYKTGPPGAKSPEKISSLWVRVPLYFGILKTICSSKRFTKSFFFMCITLAS